MISKECTSSLGSHSDIRSGPVLWSLSLPCGVYRLSSRVSTLPGREGFGSSLMFQVEKLRPGEVLSVWLGPVGGPA